MNDILQAIDRVQEGDWFEEIPYGIAVDIGYDIGVVCEYARAAFHEQTKQQEGCEYCIDLSFYKGFGYAEFFHQVAADECLEINIDVKFCPNCGRKLEVKQDD